MCLIINNIHGDRFPTFLRSPAPAPKQKRPALLRGVWSGKRDSNSRPRPWQGRALPTELFPQNVKDPFLWNGNAKIRQKFESPNIFAVFLDSFGLRPRNDKGVPSPGQTGGVLPQKGGTPVRKDPGHPIYFAMSLTRRSLRGSTWKSPTVGSMWSPPTPLSSVRKT